MEKFDNKIKNLVFDIGGIIIDDGYQNLAKVLGISNMQAKNLAKICYGKEFKKCVLGECEQNELIQNLINKYPEYEKELKFVLSTENLSKIIPYFEDNINKIYRLKGQGYRIYFLSNLTKFTYDYITKSKTVLNDFCGGVYSFEEHLAKPDKKIYLRLLEKFNLVPSETIFFDDKEKNVISAQSVGINAVVFKSFDDVTDSLK